MWQRAAKSLWQFPESVVTAVRADGYPISVRQSSARYDARTGEMPVWIPRNLGAIPGRANLLAHRHDENLWNVNAFAISGRLELRAAGWVFVSMSFNNPTSFGEFRRLGRLRKDLQRSANRYLDHRGLSQPAVDWAAIDRLHRQARQSRARVRALG
jgi:hypothetical protein